MRGFEATAPQIHMGMPDLGITPILPESPVEPLALPDRRPNKFIAGLALVAVGLGLGAAAASAKPNKQSVGFGASAEAKASNVITWKEVYASCSGGKVRPADGSDGYIKLFNDQENRLNAWAKDKIGKIFDFSPNIETLQIPPSFVDSSGKTVDTTCAGLNSTRMGMANTYYAIKKLWLNNVGPEDYVLLDLENPQGVGNVRYCGFGDVLPYMPAGYSHLVLSTVGDDGCRAGASEKPSVPPNPYLIDGDAVTMVYMLEQFTPVTNPSAVSTTSNIVEQTPLSRSWAGYREAFNDTTIDAASLANVIKYMKDSAPPPPPPKPVYKLVADAGINGKLRLGRNAKGKFVFGAPNAHIVATTKTKGEKMELQIVPAKGYHPYKIIGCESGSTQNICVKRVDNKNPAVYSQYKYDKARVTFAKNPPPISK